MPLAQYYESVTIEERSEADEFSGVTWSQVGTETIGFIQPVSGNETFRESRSGEDIEARMYCPLDTPGKYGYRVTAENGTIYKMLYASQPEGISAVNDHKEILLGRFE